MHLLLPEIRLRSAVKGNLLTSDELSFLLSPKIEFNSIQFNEFYSGTKVNRCSMEPSTL